MARHWCRRCRGLWPGRQSCPNYKPRRSKPAQARAAVEEFLEEELWLHTRPEGGTCQEIAEHLGMTRQGVWVILVRALLKMQEAKETCT